MAAETTIQKFLSVDAFPEPSLIRLKYPVILMHGFGMVAAIRRNGHMHEHAMHLRERGILAYAPNVPPYNPVPVRASVWRNRIEHILRETGASKVNIIAHSMGGLDARYLISAEGFHDRVASLITISSPHHGSSIAAFLLEQPGMLKEWLSEVANWMGTRVRNDVNADFLNTVTELTPDYVCNEFNARIQNHPDVKYWSFSARAGKGTKNRISPFLRPLNHILYSREGINDGFVSSESSRWGTYCGMLDADHAQQIGIQIPLITNFDSFALFRRISKLLKEEDL
ncbi:MAG: alpha/beta fold hydrolase [Rhodothermaceae bacterium]|nr:alpha/beta fold hydrolase [Rhodothermaceae bacterium]